MQHLRWAIGLVISGVALYVAFAGVDWSAVADSLAAANYGLFVAALPVLIGLFALRAQRWRLLFHPDKDIRLSAAFGALNVGYMAGNVLPLQLGEVARAYVLGEAEQISKARALSTIAVERVLDTLVLLTFLGVLVPFIDLPAAVTYGASLVLVVSLALAAVMVVSVSNRPWAERRLAFFTELLPVRLRPTARRWAGSILDGLSALSNVQALVRVLLLTVVSWLMSALVIYMLLRAFSLDVPVTAAPFLLVATTFGFLVPSSPGAIGVYDAISIRSLTTVFAVSHDSAASYALAAHAFYVIPPTIIGAAYFLWHQLSLRRIQEWSRPETVAPTGGPAVVERAALGATAREEPYEHI